MTKLSTKKCAATNTLWHARNARKLATRKCVRVLKESTVNIGSEL